MFEKVSIFAEMFLEMLARDFAFRIYCAVVEAKGNLKLKEEAGTRVEDHDKKKDVSDRKSLEPPLKKYRSDSSLNKKDFEPYTCKKNEDAKKSDNLYHKVQLIASDIEKQIMLSDSKGPMVTVEPYLLLAFTFFDDGRSGYLYDDEFEEIIGLLDLNLSRAQVRLFIVCLCIIYLFYD